MRHHRVDIDRAHALLDRALHAQQAYAVLVLHQLTHRAHAPVAEVIDVVDLTFAVTQIDKRLDDRKNVFLAQHAHGVWRVQLKAHVHLHAANCGKVVALRIEEQHLEKRRRRLNGRRLTGPNNPVDVHQRLTLIGVLVDVQRVTNKGPDVDVIDVEDEEILDLLILELRQQFCVELTPSLSVDLARIQIDNVLGKIAAGQIVGGDEHFFEATFRQLAGLARGDLFTRLDDHLACLGISEIAHRGHAAHFLRHEQHFPAAFRVLDGDVLVERRQDLFIVEAQRIEQRRDRQFAAPVDAHIDDILGVELEVEPRAAIRNYARCKQQLARNVRAPLVMVEENAWRPVHLTDDHALGAVDDERAVGRHERHIAHINVLLLHVLDGLRARLLVHIEHDKAQLDL